MKIQTEPFRKVAAASAAEVCERVDLSDDAKSMLVPNLSPQGFLARLVEREQMGDAVRFLAFAMPAREGIWWACVSAHRCLPLPTPLETRCLGLASAWVYEPDDKRRWACMAAAESAKFEGAAAYAALAVFWSGGSLAPEGMPECPADPKLAPIGVGASVLLAITNGDPKRLNERFIDAMKSGIDIADGGNGRLEGDRPMPSPD